MMKVLDLFCGGGGATQGYLNLECTVVGVDWHSQNRYPGEFIREDVFEVIKDRDFVNSFDLVHWSPPCQIFSRTRHMNKNNSGAVDLLEPSFWWIEHVYQDQLHIVENVDRAPMEHSFYQCLTLCGSMFQGLTSLNGRRQLRRHRKFRLYGFTVPELKCQHNGLRPLGVYGVERDNIPGGGETAISLTEGRKLMGIDWMNWRELREAVPPAYTQYIASFL